MAISQKQHESHPNPLLPTKHHHSHKARNPVPLSSPFSTPFPPTSLFDMRRKVRSTLVSIFISLIFFSCFSLYLSRDVVKVSLFPTPKHNPLIGFAIKEEQSHQVLRTQHVSPKAPDSILLPDWEVLLVDSTDHSLYSHEQYYCVFSTNITSVAKFTGKLPFSHRATFKCDIPNRLRHLRRFSQPIFTKSPEVQPENKLSPSPEIFRWGFLAYESLSTEEDLILFVKGVNNRQGVNLSPENLRCVFGDNDNSVKTTVTSSSQEVFRCHHPDETAMRRLFVAGDEKIKVSIEIIRKNGAIVPSVAYYTAPRRVEGKVKKSPLCACTMVHNVGKFLKEWVMYNSKLGVEKFILYDNDSEDELEKVVQGLVEEDYDVETLLWPWPKTQEAGFSHCAVHARDQCSWMMYMDVDEFAFSPWWLNSSYPSHHMLTSLLPNTTSILPSSLSSSSSSSSSSLSLPDTRPIGQISIRCLEFGPSNQSSHPVSGVTQGYTCRKLAENRHKSIVLLSAVNITLHNQIHHFSLKPGYRGKTLRLGEGLVNHYKFQAWSEFKAKFRRRVSAYVVDWTKQVNPTSQDRTPGLGFKQIEPEGWANKFCDVHDNRLKIATRRWFGLNESGGYKMAWQDQ